MSSRGPAGTFVVYAEQVLPTERRAALPASSPLADLHFALYFGPTPSPVALVETDAADLPLGGTAATATVPFGDRVLTLVVSPRGSLVGGFAEFIAWGIAVAGILMTFAVVILTERLVRRREHAEELAAENRRLFDGQRDVAVTLQHSLLPRRLAQRPELDLAVRYLPGTEGIEVGGDWYDVIDVDDRHVFFTVGDVAGRGLEAATMMATLRNTANAYAADGAGPDEVLAKVSRLVDIGRDGRFATVICGLIDLHAGEVTIANAGHPEPLLITDARCELVPTVVGPPVGVGRDYTTVKIPYGPGVTLVAYTDGLIERRGESLTVGLERLRQAANRPLPLEQLLDHILADLVPDGPPDDIAILGIQWRS